MAMTDFIRTSPLGPTLETRRLILRPPVREDFEGYCAYHGDEATMKHIGGTQPPGAVWRMLCFVAGAWHLEGLHVFSVIDKASGQWIGRVGPIFPYDWPGREVGWGIRSKYWGQGYGTEAAAAVMDYAVDVLGWDDIIHIIAAENVASVALAAKLGSVNRGPGRMPDPFGAAVVDFWGQTADDWHRNRARFVA